MPRHQSQPTQPRCSSRRPHARGVDMSTIRIICVDDHRLLREGITRKLERQPDMKVVDTAGTGQEAISLYRRHRPDIVLMDLHMPGMGGLHAIEAIRDEDGAAKIIVLT